MMNERSALQTAGFLIAAAICIFGIYPAEAAAQSGGGFEITKSVISGSGGAVSGGDLEAVVTGGQAVTSSSSGGDFVLFGGFWAPEQLAPTAAGVSVSGRVTNATGGPLGRATIRLTDPLGGMRSAITNPFGYFRIPDVPAGETYIVHVSHKNFIFATPQILSVDDEILDLNFVAISAATSDPGTRKGDPFKF